MLSLDLTHEELSALAHATTAARLDRHRHQAMTASDVLAMRDLATIEDGLAHMALSGAINTVCLSTVETRALRSALAEWLDGLERRGWMREDDRDAVPVVCHVLDACGGRAAVPA